MNRRLLLTTALLSLFASDIAMAQQGRPEGGRPGGGGGQPGFGQGGGQGGGQRPGGGGGGRPGGGGERPGPVTRPSPVRPGPGNGGPQIQPPRPGRPTPPRPVRPPRPQPPRPNRPQPPHRPGAGRPPHFRPVHGNPFRYPRGYAYRRWTIGLLLPSLFLSSSYYYSDYNALGVGPPPIGYRWVRYGPDLLMVSTRTGRIADVIYGAFY